MAGELPQRPGTPSWEFLVSHSISVVPGRLRRLEWLLHLGVAIAGGWIWFGGAGAVLLGLWATTWKPPKTLLVEIPVRPRRIKLSRYAVSAYWGWRCTRIFRDEMEAAEFAQLRRELKAALTDR